MNARQVNQVFGTEGIVTQTWGLGLRPSVVRRLLCCALKAAESNFDSALRGLRFFRCSLPIWLALCGSPPHPAFGHPLPRGEGSCEKFEVKFDCGSPRPNGERGWGVRGIAVLPQRA